MFICKKCHSKTECKALHLFTSYGKCETCGEIAVCYDCRTHLQKLISKNEKLVSKYPDDYALKLNLKSLKEHDKR